MKVSSKFLCVAAILICVSCGKEVKDEGDEAGFRLYNIEKQGWKSKVVTQKSGDIEFAATEVPIQYYILKDQGNEDLAKIDSIYETNKRERIIEFTFQQEDEKDLLLEEFTHRDYESSVKYLSFKIEKDFYVVTSNKDTIPCEGVNFERNFKIASFNKVLLFFSNIPPDDQVQLVYNDKLYGKGIMKFKFHAPLIKL